MKYLMFSIIFAIGIIFNSQAQDPSNVAIVCYNGSSAIFPNSWLDRKTNAKATAADKNKFQKDTTELKTAFGKYPNSVLNDALKTVYITGKLRFNRQNFLGTNSNNAIYIGSDGNQEIEKTFHHEFSSILLRNKRDVKFEEEWKKLSPYLRSGNSASAIKAGLFSTDFDLVLCQQGYLTPYSLCNFENDFNMYAENIFAGGKEFWIIVDKYPQVQAKVKLITTFYQTVWGGYSEVFFRGL